ncbi:hypothetical protein DMUE_6184, partial [Dictyocoela muelleri]
MKSFPILVCTVAFFILLNYYSVKFSRWDIFQNRKNSHTREIFRMIIALAFVPFEKPTIEYDKLDIFIKNKKEIHKITDFWEYFKNTYGKYILKKNTDISIYSYKFW